MKYLKIYSVILLSLTLLLMVLSLYIIDFMPSIYHFYMGEVISASKIDKLHNCAIELFNQINVYMILSVFTFISFYFLKTVRQYLIVMVLFLLIHFVLISDVCTLPIIKRLYKMVLMSPLLWIFFDYFKFKKESYTTKITNGFLYITLLFLTLPGLYFPPFFSGIQGWTIEIDKQKNIEINGLFLVRDDGKEVRYSRAIVSPINFVTRIDTFMQYKHHSKLNELLQFYQDVYIERYPLLKQGIMPHQKLLGRWAYPIHNPYGDFNYTDFPPNRIKYIKLSTKYYRWDKRFINEKIIATKEWR